MIREIINMGSYSSFFTKGFFNKDGDFEENQIFPESRGYGVKYSHPQHLKNVYGYKIKCFADMDKALDELEYIRALIEHDSKQITINIGTKINDDLLKVIKQVFDDYNNDGYLVKAKITSISRKHYNNYSDFVKALGDKLDYNLEEDIKQFNSHIGNLSAN